jgi:hypothetical protein
MLYPNIIFRHTLILMNTGYKLIGKCLSDDHYQNLFSKINDAYQEPRIV